MLLATSQAASALKRERARLDNRAVNSESLRSISLDDAILRAGASRRSSNQHDGGGSWDWVSMRGFEQQRRAAEREAKAEYVRSRELEASQLNTELEKRLRSLKNILTDSLAVDDVIPFDSLRFRDAPPRFSPPMDVAKPKPAPDRASFLHEVVQPSRLKFFVPRARRRFEQELEKADARYEAALTAWMINEQRRLEELTALESKHADVAEEFERTKNRRNFEVDVFEKKYRAGDPAAIIPYCKMVLELSGYPAGIPHNFKLAYTQASKQLVVEFELPGASIVPQAVEYRYTKASDLIGEKARKESDIRDLYQNIVASIALRTMHELFEADQGEHISVLCFNGFIRTIDPATEKDIQPHLISVRTAKQKFKQIDLARVDKSVCLRNLGAQVSRQAAEAQPVKPIVEFQMADARFVDQTDLVSSLSSAMNLMDLNPYEFEQLVANLFGQMGLESKLTRSSRDGGVDCVAFDARPVLGGKVVIQAKRYRHTVGVSAVRDLYGTMMNEGANKGILVTTSGYGPDAFEFAKDKPIELIEGSGLLYLLQQIGFDARIVFPDDGRP
jgi:restriction system protein